MKLASSSLILARFPLNSTQKCVGLLQKLLLEATDINGEPTLGAGSSLSVQI